MLLGLGLMGGPKRCAVLQESGEALLERMRAGRDAAAAAGAAAGAAAAAKQAAVRELTPAEAAKDEGNNAFKRGDWRGAMEQYTR